MMELRLASEMPVGVWGGNTSNKQFLFRRIAWRLQANAEGDLSERARFLLKERATNDYT